MAFLVDLTGEYDYKPVWTPPPVSPITPSYDQQQSLPYTEPAPAPTVLDPNKWAGNDPVGDDVAFAQNGGSNDGSVWNSVFQAWEKDGRLWDSESGLWFTMPSYGADPMVYREGVGDQSIPEYNDYNKVLQELYGGADGGGFAGNPLVAQPSIFQPKAMPNVSNADWTNIDAYMDRPTSVTPSAGWSALDAARDPNKGTFPTTAQPYNYNLNNPDVSKFTTWDAGDPNFLSDLRVTDPQQAGYKTDARFPTGGGMLGLPLSGQLPGILKSGYEGYQKYIQNPVAETGAQLTGPLLNMVPAIPWALNAAADAREAVGLPGFGRVDTSAGGTKGMFELLDAFRESGGNPLKFADIQNKNFAERPRDQQLLASLAYDPTNLIGLGAVSKALKGAEGASALSKILRGAGAANEAIDVGTAKAFGAGAKYLGREALGTGAGIGANALVGGEDTTGLNWWQAGALGALGGATTRKVGSGGLSDLLASAQGRKGLKPALGAQIDDVTDPVVRELLGLDKIGSSSTDSLLRPGPTQEEAAAQIVASQKLRDLTTLTDDELTIAYSALDRKLSNAESRVERMVSHFGYDDPEVLDANRGLAELEGEWQRMEDELRRRASKGEIGSVSTNIALRTGLAAGAAGAGYATADDDASTRDKLFRAAMFGGAAAVGPEVIGKAADLGAKGYGKGATFVGDLGLNKLGIGREEAVNQQRWLAKAKDAEALAGLSQRPDMMFKTDFEQKLGRRASVANAFWELASKVDEKRAAKHIMAPEVKKISEAFAFNDAIAPDVAQRWVDAHHNEFAMFDVGPNGEILVDATPIPVLGKDGLPKGGVPTGAGTSADKSLSKTVRASLYEREELITAKQKALDFLDRKVADNDTGAPMVDLLMARDDALRELENLKADYASFQKRIGVEPQMATTPSENAVFADLMENKEWYLENNYISREQYDALNTIQRDIQQYPELEKAFGIAPDPDIGIDPANGAYFTRGKPTSQARETTPLVSPEGRAIRETTTADRPRKYSSGGAGINDGLMYPSPAQAAKEYITELLRKVNAVNTDNNLMKLGFEAELRDGTKQFVKLSDLKVDPNKKNELAEQIKATRELRKDRVALQRRLKVADRDKRFAQRWVDVQRGRVEKLNKVLADRAIAQDARANAAHEILTATHTALDDSEFAAKEYLKRTEKLAVGETDTRRSLKAALSEAAKVRAGLNELGRRVDEADTADLIGQGIGFMDGWGYADSVRAAVAQDAAALEELLLKKAVGSEEAAAAHKAAQEALREVEKAFPAELKHMRDLNKTARIEQTKNAVAAERVRQALSGRETRLIDQAIKSRAAALKAATEKSSDLQVQIDQLSQMIAPSQNHTKQLQADIAATRKLARDVGEVYTGRLQRSGKGLEGWGDIPMPAKWANTFHNTAKTFAGGDSPAWKVADFINDTLRLLGATLDVSRFGSVGSLGFWDNPATSFAGFKAGAKEAKGSLRKATAGAATGQTIELVSSLEARAVADGIDVPLTRAIGTGRLQLTGAEQFHPGYADEGTWADRFSKLKGIKQADIMYSTPANIERVTRFYDSLRVQKLAGLDYTSDLAIMRAANSANLITGRATTGLGAFIIGDKAASRAFFASRFVQSQIETVMNAVLVGGVEGVEARKALLKLAMGGAALTVGINSLNGNPTDWNLFDGDYVNSNLGRIRIGDQDISVFGPWDSLVKGALMTYKGDPTGFLRTKLGPVASYVADWTTGRNAIGQKVDRDPLAKTYDAIGNTDFSDPKSIAGLVGNTASRLPMPFAARGVIDTARDTDFTDPKSIANFALSAATNITGIKASPLTEKEKFAELLDDTYPEWVPPDGIAYPKPKDPLNDPLYVAIYGETHPDKLPGATTDSSKTYAKLKDEYTTRQNANTTMFTGGDRALGEWKDKRKLLAAEKKGALAEIVKGFNGQDPPKDTPAYWLNEYYKAYDAPGVMGEDGFPDYDKLDIAQAEALKNAPSWVADYIDQYFLAKGDAGPEREYRKALQQLKADGYFSGNDNSIPKYQNMISGTPDEEIDRLNKIIADKLNQPQYAFLKGKSQKQQAVVILGDYWGENGKDYDPAVVTDVGNSTSTKYQTFEYKTYKAEHPELLIWFNDNASWETIQSLKPD